MKRLSLSLIAAVLIPVFLIGVPIPSIATGPTVTNSEGDPIVWNEWLAENGPVVVLLWASWVPNAEATIAEFDAIAAAARTHGLELIVVVVQEPLDEAVSSITDPGLPWFHDRYGHLLKAYRVVSIPRLLVLAEDGSITARLEAKPNVVRSWGGG